MRRHRSSCRYATETPCRCGSDRSTTDRWAAVRLLAYNGSIPGPLLRVAQGSDITVDVIDNAGFEQSVQWYGLPVDNRSDGLPRRPQQAASVITTAGYEREDTGDTVRLVSSESAIVDTLIDATGHAVLEHHTPDHAATLATFTVAADRPEPPSPTPTGSYAQSSSIGE
jgi:hypothetical protein